MTILAFAHGWRVFMLKTTYSQHSIDRSDHADAPYSAVAAPQTLSITFSEHLNGYKNTDKARSIRAHNAIFFYR